MNNKKTQKNVSQRPKKSKSSCRDCALFLKVHEGTNGQIIAIECSYFGYHGALSIYSKCKFFTK